MMSCSIAKHNVLKTLAKRGYATKTAPKSSLASFELEASTTTKNSRLVALKEDSPYLKLAISYKAGTIYEVPENYGISHIIRAATGLGTKKFTAFNIHRNLQQYGINLYATSDRESFTYVVESSREQLDRALNYITDIGTFPLFKPWEIKDNIARVKLELSVIPPEAKVIDLLHSTAYYGGLGNSLFCNESRVGKLTDEDCLHFFDKNFTFPRLQVTASGVDLKFLNEYLTVIELEDGTAPAVKSIYSGNHVRVNNFGENAAYIAVVGESPGISKKESLAYGVLKYVYGGLPPIKYGNSQGILSKALTKVDSTAAVTGFNAVYADSGLTGFYLVALPNEAASALKTVYSEFAKANVTDRDVNKAKAQYKSDVLLSTHGKDLVDYIAKQVAYDAITTPEQLVVAIDAVTTADVQQAAKKLASSKLSSVYYGNVAATPILSAL